MKNIIIMFAVGLLAQQITQAQGTVYLSNLGQASAGGFAVGSNSWLTAGFATGNNAEGYTLNSIQLAMTDATGNPNEFTVLLYAANGSPVTALPGTSLGTLIGSANPVTSGIFTYTASGLTLSSFTSYFIVLTAGTAVANGAYDWSYAGANSYNPIGGWSAGGSLGTSSDGLHWSWGAATGPQFAINATAIPEPGALSLFALGGLGFLWHRRKERHLR